MDAPDLLIEKAVEYELKAAAETERDELAVEQGAWPSPVPALWATVAVVLREVAAVLRAAA